MPVNPHAACQAPRAGFNVSEREAMLWINVWHNRLIGGGRTMVVLGAQELTVADAARLAGLTPCAVRHRLRIGWPIGKR